MSVSTAPLPLRRHRRLPAPPAILAAALLVAVVALVPVGFVVLVLVDTGWETAQSLIFRPRVGELFLNTVLLEVLAVPLSIALGVTMAFLTERTDIPGRRLWTWLAVAPLAVPAFIHAYAWDGLFPFFHGLWPAVFISVLAYFPFVYLPVVAQMRRLDPALEDVAASLGLPPGRAFVTVVLPQLRLAILGGAVLIGLHLLAEYGLFVLVRHETLTTAIYDRFQAVFLGPSASLLGIVLVACALGILGIDALLRGRRRYARLGPGAPRPPQRAALGRTAALLWLIVPVGTAAFSLGVPAATLGRWLVRGGAEIWDWADLAATLGQTAGYALAGAVVTTLAAMPVAWLAVRAPGRLQRLIEAGQMYVGSLPGIVIALALVTITVRVALPFYQTATLLVLAYAILFLPRAIVSVQASLAQAPVEVERAAMSLGRPPFLAFLATTFRLASPGIAAGMALVALGITTELTATLMLSPIGTATLATRFWALTSEIDYMGAAPYAVTMVLLSLPLTILLHNQARKAAGR